MSEPTCPCCTGALFDARTGTCGHTVCGACMDTRRVSTCPVDECTASRVEWAPNRTVADLVELAALPRAREDYRARVAHDTNCFEAEAAHVYRCAHARGLSILTQHIDLLCPQNRNLFMLRVGELSGLLTHCDDVYKVTVHINAFPCLVHAPYQSLPIEGPGRVVLDANKNSAPDVPAGIPAVWVRGHLWVVCKAPRNTWMRHGVFYKIRK